jgi:uncharacterized protein YecE (DUF72 family)
VKGKFQYGTAGWSYTDWVGPFYPKGTRESDFLTHYGGRFGAVEVDSSYYRIPSERMTRAWDAKTHDRFVFVPKMVGDVTHKRFLEDCGDLTAKFLAAFGVLGPKLGPVVLQFRYFRKAEGVTLGVFLKRLLPYLDELPDGLKVAVETRNKAFLKPKLFDALRDRGAALVLVDHVWMPRPHEYLKMEEALTADFTVVRLLGDRKGIEKVTKKWDRVVEDKSERIAAWAEVIRAVVGKGVTVQAFANNHFAGHAPATIAELAGAVAGR